MAITGSSSEQALMKTIVLADPDTVARRAATIIALEARAAAASRGRFIMAVSGGHTPWVMLRALVDEDVPWEHVHLLQVDERIGARGKRGSKPHSFAGEPAGPCPRFVPEQCTRCP
jgi:6-phosphogluconolactonase/glucosamine-6-phosphate isomerase/deaminase